MRTIPSSELIINDDGSIFHLHLKPEQLADIVILVGDPGRVAMVASFFDTQEYSVSNREFNTVTGTYKGKRMTVLSTGIGIGNIDISVTELDALANVDFATRQEKAQKRQLTLVRLGTSGAIQPDIKVGQFVFARTSVGFDGLLNYYRHHHRRPRLLCAAGTLGASRTGRHPSEREDRVVRLSRTPGHQFRDGKFCFGRAGRSHGPQSRHDLYDHRSADRAGRLHGL